jgi:hypothetical protein
MPHFAWRTPTTRLDCITMVHARHLLAKYSPEIFNAVVVSQHV